MKFAIVLFAVVAVAVAAAAPPKVNPNNDVQVLKEYNDVSENSYKFGFEQSDGTKRDETGEVKLLGENEGVVMRGSYEYVGPDGNTYRVDYVADENGFQPTGAHLVGK
ncbi:flexible cuticle protein 12-like [Chironomus tepperi]|uniref:flexible cuticle protein 12-like n=1 Tax=Chironomus tepperi TaxID=113505 RepID=UPI00391FC184